MTPSRPTSFSAYASLTWSAQLSDTARWCDGVSAQQLLPVRSQEWGFDQSPDAPLVGTDAPDGRGITVTKLPLRQHSEPALSQTEQRMRNVASAASLDDDEVKDIQQAVDSLTLARSISEVDLDSEDVRNRIRAVYPLGYCNTDVHGRPVKVRFHCSALSTQVALNVPTGDGC
eukprot:scaffold4470_cov255-Prasinococcus_capsulatus_cf.AAC.5